MTVQKYSKQEALNRIWRVLAYGDGYWPQWTFLPETAETLQGEVLSEDEALSRIAELLQNTLDEYEDVSVLPPGIAISNLMARPSDYVVATDFAGRGTDNYINAWVLNDSHVYGEIYTRTGTVTMQLTGGSWTKITGSFQNGLSPSYNMSSTPSSDQLLTSRYGHYFIVYDVSYIGSSAVTYEIGAYSRQSLVPQSSSFSTPSVSGSATNVHGSAIVYISGSSSAIDLRVNPSGNAFFKLLSGQIIARRLTNGATPTYV